MSKNRHDEIFRLRALNAVLEVIVRHPNLLQRDAFDELARAIDRLVPFAQMGVLVPEKPVPRPQDREAPSVAVQKRLYAVSRAERPAVMPFGGKVDVDPAVPDRVYSHQEIAICDDTRAGIDIERAAAALGVLSYVRLPIRTTDSEGTKRVVAELVLGFAETSAPRRAPLDLLQEIADAIGGGFDRVRVFARERRLALILDTSEDAMLAWDRAGRVTDANGAAATLTGRSMEELIGMRIGDLLDPLPDSVAPDMPEDRMELLALDRNGLPRPIIVSATLTEVDDDALVAAHALLRDLTHVVEAEKGAALGLARVRELEEQHRTLLDNAPVIIFRLDPETRRLLFLNLHAERLLGIPMHEALATEAFLRDLHIDPEGVAAFESALQSARTGGTAAPYLARLRRRGADAISARGTVYPLVSDSGEVVAIEGVLADVTAEEHQRTRLVQNDRLATLGTLVASVAHEINNPAAFMLLGLDRLDRLLKGPGVALDDSATQSAGDLVRELRDSIRRIVDIVRDLRFFSTPPTGRRTIIDVNSTIESAVSLTRSQILERAQIVRRLGDVPPVIMEDGRLGQVIVNLLVNAAQAIPKDYGAGAEHYVSVTSRLQGHMVEIEVRDTGVGISRENLARIWQPFFTTKSPDVGTGLGLSISREIVERAGGLVWAESPIDDGGVVVREGLGAAPPRGSRFVIALPAAGLAESTTRAPSPIPLVPARRVRVLLVEDEPALARALATELGALHDVTHAESAEAACELLNGAERGSFDVILCDLRMPGMSGEAFYSKIRSEDEELAAKFIFMTGVGFGTDVERFIAMSNRPVLEKPFTAEAALDAIVKVVSSGP